MNKQINETAILMLLIGVSACIILIEGASTGNLGAPANTAVDSASGELEEAESEMNSPEWNEADDDQDESEPKEAASNSVAWPDNYDTDEQAELGADSNIANAKIDTSRQDLATAAGHHHHHGHYAHGWLKMGAHTGHKGAFGWHDKHPVGKG